MPTQIKLPNLGENIESGDVLSIFVKEGDTVTANQDLMEIETDKATMPIPAPQPGKIVKILVGEGDTIKVGDAIMEIDGAGAAVKEAAPKASAPTTEEKPKAAKPKAPEPEEEVAQEEETPAPKAAPKRPRLRVPEPEEDEEENVPSSTPASARTKKASAAGEKVQDTSGDGHAAAAAGPAVRRLARQLGVDLRRVRPTGAAGRVTVEDVRAHIRETNEQITASTPRGVTPPGSPDTDDFGGVRLEKMSRMRQTIARNMIESYTTIPQLTNFDDVDITELEDMREQSKRDYAERGIKLTGMSFVIKAVASSLKRHPVLNASVNMESNTIIYKEYVNIGVAVDTDRGLVVPVLRDADRKSISQIASELEELAITVREGKFDLDLIKGGTFTVSNLGSVGGIYSTPIINPPQVAILLVGRSRLVPQLVGEKAVGRLMMPLSISYDHRLVDGAAAARFTNDIKGYLGAPGRLLLAP